MHSCCYLLSGENWHPVQKPIISFYTQFSLKTKLFPCLQSIAKEKQEFQSWGDRTGQFMKAESLHNTARGLKQQSSLD